MGLFYAANFVVTVSSVQQIANAIAKQGVAIFGTDAFFTWNHVNSSKAVAATHAVVISRDGFIAPFRIAFNVGRINAYPLYHEQSGNA